jgi:hypothetical protein
LMARLHLTQRGDYLGAFGHGDRATWVENTPRRRAQRTRYLSAQYDALSMGFHVGVQTSYSGSAGMRGSL